MFLLKRGIVGKSNAAPESLKSLGGIPEFKPINPVGGRAVGEVSHRDYDPDKIGIPIRNLSTKNIKVTHRGIDFVEKHLSRFGSNKPNEVMVQRLRKIADGKIQATQQDLNFYAHELRESVRYKKLGYPTGQPKGDEARELWNNAHTPTLEEYRIRENNSSLTDNPLYHSDATKFFFEDNK